MSLPLRFGSYVVISDRPTEVHNFLTKQYFKLKFYILAILMTTIFHMTILINFDQIWGQILTKLGQILVKIFKNHKSEIFRLQKGLISNFEHLAHWIKFWCWLKSKIGPNGQNFSNFEIKHFWTLGMSIFLVFEIFYKNLAKFDHNLAQNLVKMHQNGQNYQNCNGGHNYWCLKLNLVKCRFVFHGYIFW